MKMVWAYPKEYSKSIIYSSSRKEEGETEHGTFRANLSKRKS